MTLRLNGSTSGYTEIDAPAVAGNNTIALPTGNGSAYQILRNGATAGSLEYTDNIVSGTAVASTSGTSIDFTGIPSWAKRVTVMFNGVSTNGSSIVEVRVGSGSVSASGYYAVSSYGGGVNQFLQSSTGFNLDSAGVAASTVIRSGALVLTLIGSNTWVGTGSNAAAVESSSLSGNSPALSGALDRIRVTTQNGTDTFDAGSINILYE
jgi:hypothetical protein